MTSPELGKLTTSSGSLASCAGILWSLEALWKLPIVVPERRLLCRVADLSLLGMVNVIDDHDPRDVLHEETLL
jgi:hypothetical protein